MIGDLHCHSHISDGSMGIDDLILYAKRAALDFVALTDHDTMAGVKRAEQLGKRYGIGVISGVELSTVDNVRNRKVHLLCYLPKNPDRLEGLCKRMTETRDKAIRESLHKVMRFFPITEDHVLRFAAGASSLYSVHIMQALMDLGYTGEIYGDLYRQLLSPRGSCYVSHEYPDVKETAETIHSAGGICVLAHPTVYDSLELMEELGAEGLIDGVERYYPRVKEKDIPALDAAIHAYDLIATGGTDFHGCNSPHPNPIGTCLTMQESIESLFKRSKSK